MNQPEDNASVMETSTKVYVAGHRGMVGSAVYWDRLDDLDRVPTTILATTSWTFENSQVLSLKRRPK